MTILDVYSEQIEQDKKWGTKTLHNIRLTSKISFQTVFKTRSYLTGLQQQTNVLSGARPGVNRFEVFEPQVSVSPATSWTERWDGTNMDLMWVRS